MSVDRRVRTMIEIDESSPIINDDMIDHHCFGCGNLNSTGLHLRFRRVDDGCVWADFTPTGAHEGYLSMTHGGILATMLDEAMSWAITTGGDMGVTGRLSLAFRRPARLGEPLRVVGRIVTRGARTIETSGEIYDIDSGRLVANAEGRFMRVSREQAAVWRAAYGDGADGSVFGDAPQRNAAALKD